jgi:hypothetical protein
MIAPIAPITATRSSRRAADRDPDTDDFLGEDIGYPNPRAQYRGYRMLLALIFLAGVVALIGGALQGGQQIVSAFPTAQALTDGAAWAKFFAGLGQVGTVGLIVVVAALFLRWRIRRKRRRA